MVAAETTEAMEPWLRLVDRACHIHINLPEHSVQEERFFASIMEVSWRLLNSRFFFTRIYWAFLLEILCEKYICQFRPSEEW